MCKDFFIQTKQYVTKQYVTKNRGHVMPHGFWLAYHAKLPLAIAFFVVVDFFILKLFDIFSYR